MIKLILVIVVFIGAFVVTHAQIPDEIQKEAMIYYADLKSRYAKESANFSLEYKNEHGVFPGLDTTETFFSKFHRQEREVLLDSIRPIFGYISNAREYLERRLLIWELMDGGRLPDSTFILLMEKYYKLAPEDANGFCVERWKFMKIHEMDIIKAHDIPQISNYPYVESLFANLSTVELINTLLMDNHLSEDSNIEFINICAREIKQRYEADKYDEIVQYVKAIEQLKPKEGLNEYFISVISSID